MKCKQFLRDETMSMFQRSQKISRSKQFDEKNIIWVEIIRIYENFISGELAITLKKNFAHIILKKNCRFPDHYFLVPNWTR